MICFQSIYSEFWFVSVELGSTVKSPARTPTKVYTPLVVTSTPNCNFPVEREVEVPVTPENKDGILHEFAESLNISTSPQALTIAEATLEGEEHESAKAVETAQGESLAESVIQNTTLPDLGSMVMESLPGTSTQHVAPAGTDPGGHKFPSPRFTSFLRGTESLFSPVRSPQKLEEVQTGTQADVEMSNPEPRTEMVASTITGNRPQSMVITRQEAITLDRFIRKIHPASLRGTGEDNCDIHLDIVDDLPQSPVKNQPEEVQDRELGSPNTVALQYSSCEDMAPPSGKRHRPKYTLKTSMLRKHPYLKFSATGPLNRQNTPHKWWCRVCRVELSLMSRGVLELLSHYRTEGHLIKEHRIRLEIPGMPLYDRFGNELHGIMLQEAKRVAKEKFPIAPQLDTCKLLVGQDKLPDFGSTTSPSEDIIAQIGILEQGLRYGGHIDCLIGIWNEMVRASPSSGENSPYSWSRQRVFVSIPLTSSICLLH